MRGSRRPAAHRRGRVVRRCARTASRSTPSSASTPERAQRGGHQHRSHPGRAVVGLERERPPVGQRDGVAGLGAGLADGAGDRGEQRALVARRCRRRSAGWRRIASATRAASASARRPSSRGPAGRRRGPARSARSRAAARRSRRRPPASTGSPVELARRWRRSPAAAGGRGRGRSRCPSRWPHRWRASRRACPSSSSDRRLARPPARISGSRACVVERVVRRGLQRGLVEAGAARGSGVPPRRGTAPPSATRRPAPAGPAAGRARARTMPSAWTGLLHERGSTGRVDVAHRPVDRAVGGQGDHRPVVMALDESGADDLGDDGTTWAP